MYTNGLLNIILYLFVITTIYRFNSTMSHYTNYGSGALEIDVENPDKNESKPFCFFTEKLVYYSFTALAVLFLIIYLFVGHFGHDNDAMAQMKVAGSDASIPINSYAIGMYSNGAVASDGTAPSSSDSVITNCALPNDKSCDVKYGCITYQDDIQVVIDSIYQNWGKYAEYIQSQTDELLSPDGCIATKLINEPLICSNNCDEVGINWDLQQPNLCKNTFLDEMKSTLKPYRRACIASLLGHQYSNLCGRKKSISVAIEIATFNWWRDQFVVSSSWTHQDCPYYI